MSASERKRDPARDDAIVRAAVRAASGGEPPGVETGSRPCPDPETLAARHEGRLASREARSVDEHATSCARCAETLAYLGGGAVDDDARATLPGDGAAIVARRNKIALLIGIAAVAAAILGARLLLLAGRGEGLARDGGSTVTFRSSGVVVAARGAARLEGGSRRALPGDVLDAGARVVVESGGAVVVATASGFRSLDGSAGDRALVPDDGAARAAASAIHDRARTRIDRIDAARDVAPRVAPERLDLAYPVDQIAEERPEFVLAVPTASEFVVVVRRGDPREPDLLRFGPVTLPCPFPAGADPLEPGVDYRVRLETPGGVVVASSAFTLADSAGRDAARRALAAAERAVDGSLPADVLRSLVFLDQGFPSEALRAGLRATRAGGVSAGFLHELGIAARGLGIESLAGPWLDGP